jgi:YVTN family beta-propeller protein
VVNAIVNIALAIDKRWHRLVAGLGALLLLFVLLGLVGAHSAALPEAAAFSDVSQKWSSSAIAVTPDGDTLMVVNPDSNSLTLVDTISNTVVAELAVGVNPRSVAVAPDGATAYVANQGSDDLSVIDLSAHTVVTEVAVGDRPVGVAVSPDGRFIAVAEMGDDRVRFLDAAALRTLSTTAVADRPHGLAFTPDSRRLLVTHLLSGEVTVLPVQPFTLYLPLILKPQVTQHAIRITPSNQRLPSSRITTWPNVAPAPAVVVNGAGTRAYLPQTMANGLGLNTQFDTTVFPKVSVLNLATNSHQTSEHIPLPERDQPVGLPWDVALARDDTELWVVNAGSNDVSVLDISDPSRPSRVAHIFVGDNPRGIVLSPDGSMAYVNNTLAGTVSVIDAGAYTVTDVLTVTDIPLPPILLHGKRLYHSSARSDLAQAAWISCNTCHVEGEHDGRTWLLQFIGEAPPGAVITRNTTSLLGMIETYPLRWSAEWDESADSEFSVRFEQFGAGLIQGEMHPTLGTPNQGRSYDLDCLAAFIDSLAAPERTHTLTPAEQRGKAIFESAETGCAACHPAPLYTDLQVHDVGTADSPSEWFGPLIDTPTLRFLYDSAPYLHDGSAATMRDVLTIANPNDEHGVTSHLTENKLADLIAFLLALP